MFGLKGQLLLLRQKPCLESCIIISSQKAVQALKPDGLGLNLSFISCGLRQSSPASQRSTVILGLRAGVRLCMLKSLFPKQITYLSELRSSHLSNEDTRLS